MSQVSIFDLLRQFETLRTSKYYLRLEKQYRTNNAIVRQSLSMISALVLTHIFGCFWFLTAKLDDYGPDTWPFRFNFIDQPVFNQYLYSFYWAMQTLATLGYGDLPAITPKEIFLCLVWMIVGVGFYSFVVGNFSSILTGNVQMEATIHLKIISIKELARKAEFPLELLHKT